MASRSSSNPLKVNRYPRQVPKQLLRYQQLIRKAAKLNPLPSSTKDADVEKKKGRDRKPFPNNLIKRLQHRRDQILRFMTDLSVPFDNNGSERDLPMIKLQQTA